VIRFTKHGDLYHDAHLEWIRNQLGYTRGWSPKNTVTMGWYSGSKLGAVVVYHDYCPEYQSISMSAAATDRRWLSRNSLYKLHHYPFVTAGCRLVVLQVSEYNDTMLSIAERFGYQMTRIPQLRGPDEAEIVCTLDAASWRANKATTSYLAKN